MCWPRQGCGWPRRLVTTRVVDGDVAVTAWHRLVPTGGDADWADVGRMVALVHALDADDLPADYPLPPCESFPWWDFDGLLPEVDSMLDPAARAGILAAIERHGGWRTDERVVCHGDVHPDNVMATASGTVLLDWDLLCVGPPAWDHTHAAAHHPVGLAGALVRRVRRRVRAVARRGPSGRARSPSCASSRPP